MRRAALAVVSTVAALVMLLSFKSHSATSSRPAAIGAGTPDTTGAGTGSAAPAAGSSSAAAAPSTSSSTPRKATTTSRTVTGNSVDTRWGPVQVRLTVRSGKITKVEVVSYPNGNPRDQDINSYALPQLVQETLSAQSAKIDTISGATVTSDGYIGSLQSALDKAGL